MAISKTELQIIINFIDSEKLNIKYSQGWMNYSQYTKAATACILDIQDRISLQAILALINSLNANKKAKDVILVRPAAGGNGGSYSQSYAVHGVDSTDIVVRLVGNEFNQIHAVDNKKQSVVVGGSIQIGALNKLLYEQHNLTLPTSGLNPYLSLSGLISTGGNGTGKDQPSMAGLALSLEICLPNGKIVTLTNTHKNFATIRAAHLGLFGIILNIEVQCCEGKKLECVKQVMSLPDFLQAVKNGFFKQDPYISVMISHLYKPDELTNKINISVKAYRWRPVERTSQDVNARSTWAHMRQQIESVICDNVFSKGLAAFPSFIPTYMQKFMVPSAVGTQTSLSVSSWYSSVHHQTGYPSKLEDTGYLFEVSDDSLEIVKAITKIFETLAELSKSGLYPIIFGMYIRYIQGTNGGLSTSRHADDKHVCTIDLVSNNEIPGVKQLQEILTPFFLTELKAAMHLGKHIPEGYTVDSLEFKQALDEWYKEHNISAEKNMLFTPYFCKLLNLPYSRDLPKLTEMKSPRLFNTKVQQEETRNLATTVVARLML